MEFDEVAICDHQILPAYPEKNIMSVAANACPIYKRTLKYCSIYHGDRMANLHRYTIAAQWSMHHPLQSKVWFIYVKGWFSLYLSSRALVLQNGSIPHNTPIISDAMESGYKDKTI